MSNLSQSQRNTADLATEALAALSDTHMLQVIEAHLSARPISPEIIEAFSNKLGRLAHMKARNCPEATT